MGCPVFRDYKYNLWFWFVIALINTLSGLSDLILKTQNVTKGTRIFGPVERVVIGLGAMVFIYLMIRNQDDKGS